MEHMILSTQLISDSTVRDVLNRDAILWIGSGFEDHHHLSELVSNVALLPWRFVLCESSDTKFLNTVDEYSKLSEQWIHRRGYVHIVASDPRDINFPPRSLPFFCLNGRRGVVSGPETARLAGNAALRRRLNMLASLENLPPKRLIVLNFAEESLLPELEEMWKNEFDALLTILSNSNEQEQFLQKWLETTYSPASIEFPHSDLADVLEDLLQRARELLPDSKVVVRYAIDAEQYSDVDLTSAELPEHPVLEDYELIRTRDLLALRTLIKISFPTSSWT